MSDKNSIQALIRLIEDPDENIFQHVRNEIIGLGSDAIPLLENSWEEDDYGLLFQSRIEDLIQEIQAGNIQSDIKNWLDSEEKDLLHGAILIAKLQFPNLDEEKILSTINSIYSSIWLELSEDMTCFEKIRTFNRVFFQDYGFHGNKKNLLSPENSFINRVLESKKGNPLSLGLVYSVIAQRLGMPIYGVNLPNQYVLTYIPTALENLWDLQKGGIDGPFYINVFARGGLFDRKEIKRFLESINQPELPEYFEPCSNTATIRRMVNNIINGYTQIGNQEKIDLFSEIRDLF